MNQELQRLNQRIKEELDRIDQVVENAAEAWSESQRLPELQSHFLNSLAFNLHSFYHGLERIFELIARRLDPATPTGAHWHRDLLEQMAQEIPNVRPSVLTAESAENLKEFLAFRHLVRNLYAFDLNPERLSYLINHLPDTWKIVKADIEAFRSLLKEASQTEST